MSPDRDLLDAASARLLLHIEAVRTVLGPGISEPLRELATEVVDRSQGAVQQMSSDLGRVQYQLQQETKKLSEELATANRLKDTYRAERNKLKAEIVRRSKKARRPVPDWVEAMF